MGDPFEVVTRASGCHRQERGVPPIILDHSFGVMAGLVAPGLDPGAIHVLSPSPASKAPMPAKTGSPPRYAAGCLSARACRRDAIRLLAVTMPAPTSARGG